MRKDWNTIMKRLTPILLVATTFGASPASAAEISTHILDLARGNGGANVPVTLVRRDAAGAWAKVAEASTDANGRVRSFGPSESFIPGTYRLQFDMTRYAAGPTAPFFPEIVITFSVTDAGAHYHVPVAVSPFGYSTYRGN